MSLTNRIIDQDSRMCVVSEHVSVLDAMSALTLAAKFYSCSVPLVVVSSDCQMLGIVTDGDLRRSLVKFPDTGVGELPVTVALNKDHFSVTTDQVDSGVIEMSLGFGLPSSSWVPVIDEHSKYRGLLSTEWLLELPLSLPNVECVVIGLGFVGQTLAVHMARSGLVVYGVDISTEILETLRLGESSFFEEGMSERLRQTHGRRLTFHHKIPQRKDSSKIRCYILAVGTPIDSGGADLAALSQALSDALADSSENDLVVVRSTVPLGTCRNIVAGMIEKYGYQIGTNFFLAMAPERTVEGKALDELRMLPQLVGAFDSRSLDRAVTVFQTFSSSVIKLESLESAELSKLVCNSWRDLTFGFVNELALVCETLSVSAHELVHKCNYEYPRASLPIPSPGVGGYCLTKDPLLYAEGVRSLLCEFDLSPISEMSRMANEVAAKMPDRALKRFLKTTAKRISELGILVVGIAFKGSPETDDLRFSTAVQFLDRLKAQDLKTVSVIDALVTTEKLKYFGEVSSVNKPVDDSIDIIFILNNHPLNRVLNIEAWLGMTHARMICDPWDLFGPQRNKIEESGVSYETMGYRTVKE